MIHLREVDTRENIKIICKERKDKTNCRLTRGIYLCKMRCNIIHINYRCIVDHVKHKRHIYITLASIDHKKMLVRNWPRKDVGHYPQQKKYVGALSIKKMNTKKSVISYIVKLLLHPQYPRKLFAFILRTSKIASSSSYLVKLLLHIWMKYGRNVVRENWGTIESCLIYDQLGMNDH